MPIGTFEGNMNVRIDPSKTYTIMSKSSGYVLDVKGGSKEDGAEIIQFHSHKGLNQKWKFIPLKEEDEGYYKIVSVNSEKCLTVKDKPTENGTKIIQYSCQDKKGVMNQEWKLFPVPFFGNTYGIASKLSKRLVTGESSEDGATIIESEGLQGGQNQLWTLYVTE
jgi:Ricin-type beta-trefoil lectin domain-like